MDRSSETQGDRDRPVRVLCVDVVPGAVRSTARSLERASGPFEVATATDGREAGRLLADASLDCVICAHRPPDLDGLALVTAVREARPDLPSVLFTDQGDERLASEAIAAGVADYVRAASVADGDESLADRVHLAVERHAAGPAGTAEPSIEAAFDALSVGIAILRADGGVVALNDRAESLLAVGPDAPAAAGAPRLPLADLPSASAVAAGERVEGRVIPVGSADESRQWVRVSAAPIGGGADARAGYAIADVTEDQRRAIEREAHLDRITDGFVTVDEDWRVTYANRRAAELLGRDRAAVVGDVLWEAFPEVVGTPFEDAFVRAMAAAEPVEIEAEYEPLGAWFEVRAYPSETGLSLSFQNVTDRHERETYLERNETIVQTVQDGVYTLDASGRFTFVNDAFVDLAGVDRADLLGEHVSLLLPEPQVEAGRQRIADLLSGAREAVSFEMTTPDASGDPRTYDVEVTALPADEGEFRGTIGVVRDVTERKARERELERQNERLAEFASIASHDLRSPLTVAQGYLDLARDSGDPADFDRIERAHDRMAALIDDLLTLARDGQRVEQPRLVTLAPACEAAWTTVDSGEASLSLALGDAAVEADPDRLRSLLENLLSNAVAHGAGADGRPATIEVGALDGGAGFYVADDGPGIPALDRSRVFERGFTTSDDGTGFGLAIVEQVAEAHGWSVTASESAAGGARFEVRTG
ncbi:MAG: PAS domain-containing protein [Haloarculaceae archaeon]